MGAGTPTGRYSRSMGLLWAMSLPGLACLLVLLAALERIGLWATGRSWLPWRRRRPAVSATAFDELTALFHASKQVELQQRRTELMLRDEEGDGAPGRIRFHLDDPAPVPGPTGAGTSEREALR